MMMSQNVALTRDRSAQRGTDAKDREARDEADPFYVGFAISGKRERERERERKRDE